jgi:hypothetical protein
MIITRCPECKGEISTAAERCPYCGSSLPAEGRSKGPGFEWRSSKTFYGYPLIHIAFGRDAERRLRIAKGVIAIGQFGVGLITFAQFGIGILFGFGQFVLGITAVGQIAISLLFGVGQVATGYVAIGQLALGFYALCQVGFAKYLWTPQIRDVEAVDFFYRLCEKLRDFLRLSN